MVNYYIIGTVLLCLVAEAVHGNPFAPASADTLQAGKQTERTLYGVNFTFVQIPGGSFRMGANNGDDDELPPHDVVVEPFKMLTTEVTQLQWKAVMGQEYNPSFYRGDDRPVDRVSWEDCQEFVMKLNQADPKKGYDLPSEAQWEYACRAGSTTLYFIGDRESDLALVGWFKDNSKKTTQPVATKQPNKWGLFDMHGNVWEWCRDFYHDNYIGAPETERSWQIPATDQQVIRGGGWNSKSDGCRSTNRGSRYPADMETNLGFRVICW